MPVLVAAALVAVLHMAIGWRAWFEVGLLADDHEMIGAAILRHRGDWTLGSAFFPEPAPLATRALFRPFVDLLFWLELPWFGIEALGYHVVNSVMHCGTALLWCELVRRWSGSAIAGLAAALAFVGWPGHGEATHWIAARVSVQASFFASAALLLHDTASTASRPLWRRARLGLAAVLLCAGIGAKESAVLFLPVFAWSSWHHTGSLRAAVARTAPAALATLAWLTFRASQLGTWGTGTHYGWRFDRVTFATCADWLALALAPVHLGYSGAGWMTALVALHGMLLSLAWRAARMAGRRSVLMPAAALLLGGYLAGIGLERIDAATLQNARYGYEAALGLAVAFGIGIAGLPTHRRGLALGALVLLHAVVLDANRRSWLSAARMHARLHQEVLALARDTQQPVRVFDAPGVRDGAFAVLNGHTQFLFWRETAPPGVDLRGAVASTQEWAQTLRELASAAGTGLPLRAHVVRWSDGGLAPLPPDPRWPAKPVPDVEIAYARIAREAPFAGDALPVHVLGRSERPAELEVLGRAPDGTVLPGGRAVLPASATAEPMALSLALPGRAAGAIAVELLVRADGQEFVFQLGTVRPEPRR